MPPFVLIGLAAGLASAVLFASATMGNPAGRILLFFLAPLPAFLAGLGWGAWAAAVSAVSASLGLAALVGPKSGFVLLLSQGIPVAALCYLAQLNRQVAAAPSGQGTPSGPAAVEWYPIGRMVAWATVMAGLLAVLTMMLLGGSIEEMRKVLRDLLEKVFLQQLPVFRDRKLSEEEIVLLTDLTLYTFPAASAFTWLAGLLLNLYLAGRITLASGRLPRPWPDLPAMAFPRGFGFALAAGLAGVLLLAGWPRLVASGFAGALMFAYTLLGLAIIHYSTRGAAARPFILSGVYAGLFLLNTWAALALALLGALEPIIPLRRWKDRSPPPPPPRLPGT